MMQQSINEFERARKRIAGDLRTMITDSEDFLKSATNLSEDGFALARAKFEKKLESAKASLAEASQPLIDGTHEVATVARDYVRGNPWTTAGIALVAGVLIGFLAGRR